MGEEELRTKANDNKNKTKKKEKKKEEKKSSERVRKHEQATSESIGAGFMVLVE